MQSSIKKTSLEERNRTHVSSLMLHTCIRISMILKVSRYQDKKIPSALTMDAAIEHSFKNDQWVLTFKVKNLTNRRVVSEFNRPLPGRYIGVKVRYLLK